MSIKRRVFLKGTMAASATSVAVVAGLLTPQALIAAWNEASFQAKLRKTLSPMPWATLRPPLQTPSPSRRRISLKMVPWYLLP